MDLGRIFALVGITFGAVFVFVNAGGVPTPLDVMIRVVGLVLVAMAVWSTLVRARAPAGPWSGSVRVYWVAVGAEVVAIPAGAAVLTRVLDRPELVVSWVVFVVGAHFLPARAFGIGWYAELGALLMLVAVVTAAVHVGTGVGWVPPAGGVLAGAALLVFSAAAPLTRSTPAAKGAVHS